MLKRDKQMSIIGKLAVLTAPLVVAGIALAPGAQAAVGVHYTVTNLNWSGAPCIYVRSSMYQPSPRTAWVVSFGEPTGRVRGSNGPAFPRSL